MLPEPEVTSRSTVPETCKVRSKLPVSAAAWSGRVANPMRMRASPRTFKDFISLRLRNRVLLQNHLAALFESVEQLGLGAVGDTDFHCDLLFAFFGIGIRNFNRGFAVLVIEERSLRESQHILVFVQQDFRIGGHHGFQFALGVINGNPDFKGGYII